MQRPGICSPFREKITHIQTLGVGKIIHILYLNLIPSIDIVKLLPVKNEGEAITPLIIFQ
jgi:hypothetical protein